MSRTLRLFNTATKGVTQLKRTYTSQEDNNGACSYSMCREAQKDILEVSASDELLPGNCSFEERLLEAVDEGLSSLGDSAKQAIYFYLEETFNVSKRDIPYRIDEFAEAIERVFGNGARLLEIEIMRRLYGKVRCFFKYPSKDDLTFAAYVKAVRHASRSQVASEHARPIDKRLLKLL